MDLTEAELVAVDHDPALISVPQTQRLLAEVRRRRAEERCVVDAVAIVASLAGIQVGQCCYQALEGVLEEVLRLRRLVIELRQRRVA